jgi:hypothetical protein
MGVQMAWGKAAAIWFVTLACRRGRAGGLVEVAGGSACGVGLPVPLLGMTEAGEGLGEGGEE